MITWADPVWLMVGGAAAAGLVALGWWGDHGRLARLRLFARGNSAETDGGFSPVRRWIRRGLLVLGVLLVGAALARPQWGFTWQETKRKGIDVLIALDTSRSMRARDVAPDRLERARIAVLDFVEKNQGDRVGLIPFAGTAFLLCPLTLDHAIFQESLAALDTEIIPKPGTNLAAAIGEAVAAFRTAGTNHKFLILITDGEDLSGEGLRAAQDAAREGVTIFTIGVGTPEGELVPLRGADGRTGLVKDGSGNPVRSKLDEVMLQRIAEATGGFYRPLGPRGEGLDAVYEQKLKTVPKETLRQGLEKRPRERFPWFLLAAACVLAAGLVVSERRTTGNPARWTAPWLRNTALAAIVLGLLPGSARAGTVADESYRKGDYTKAAEEYALMTRERDNPQAWFNRGAAEYKAGLFEAAAGSFERGLRTADPAWQQKMYYNLGNTHYRIGEAAPDADARRTHWARAVKAYEDALALDANDQQARENLEFVRQRMKEEQKKQDEKKQQEKKDGDKKEDPQPSPQNNQDQKTSDSDEKKPEEESKKQSDEKSQSGGENGKEGRQPPSKKPEGTPEKNQPSGDGSTPPSQKPAPSPSPGQPDGKETQGEGQPQPARPQGEKPDTKKEGPAAQPAGRMSREQATQLLNSLKSDERNLPVFMLQQAPQRPASEQGQDW